MRRVRCSEAAREAPKFTAVVVFPTPPFWLAMAMILAKMTPSEVGNVAEKIGNAQDVSRETFF